MTSRFDRLRNLVRGEYLEMPGLHLTLAQAQRLWQLHNGECETVFNTLVESGFLTKTARGGFVLTGTGRMGA